MILKQTIMTFDRGSCTPRYRGGANLYAKYVKARGPKLNTGKHWHWRGTPPHPTRMHHYASFTTSQKSAWAAWGGAIANNHTPTHHNWYTGTNAYMMMNLAFRLTGRPYTDIAPPFGTPVSLHITVPVPATFASQTIGLHRLP